MVKTFIKHLLSLSILLSGYGQLSADPCTESTFDSSIRNLKNSENSGSDLEQNGETLYFKHLFGTESQNCRLNVPLFENEKEEDDELTSSKKHLRNNNYTTSFFLAWASGFFVTRNKKILPFHTYLSYTPLHQYLIFQVFRI